MALARAMQGRRRVKFEELKTDGQTCAKDSASQFCLSSPPVKFRSVQQRPFVF